MNIENIFTCLDENHRKAVVSIIVSTLMFHSVFYFTVPAYASTEWYSQLLFSAGVATGFVIFQSAIIAPSFENSLAFYYPPSILASAMASCFISYLYTSSLSLATFLIAIASASIICTPICYFSAWRTKKRINKIRQDLK